jgi:hypothetical protein
MKKLLIFASVCLSVSAYAERWNKANDPSNFSIQIKGQMRFQINSLPLTAKLKDERLGWSESYWPSMLGGIAYRWNHPNPTPFKYRMHTREEVMRMSEAELSQLSPAELYDISQSDYKYSLTNKVLKTYSPKDLWWEGICHGWALAAVHYPEPDKTVVINKEGVRVPFGASDVKGLLAMHDSFNSKGVYSRVGARCGVEGKVAGEAFPEDVASGNDKFPNSKAAETDKCRDVNAGALHVVLGNMIGLYSQGFVADVDRFNDVWNQPVVAYESKLHEDVAVTPTEFKDGVRRKVRVTTKMIYGDELEFFDEELVHEGVLGFVSKEPVTRTAAQTWGERNYEYVLELDAGGAIIGGEWISQSRPDFIWMKAKDPRFLNGRFPLAGLNEIYKPVKL